MTVTSTSTESLYDVLGVSENATPDDIKRAYYQLVRKFRPNEHPETFQRFNDARWILEDSPRRNKYDQMRRYGRRLKALLDEADAMAKQDPHKAIPLLRSAVALAPALPLPRALLAEVMVQTGEYSGAERQYRWLTKDSERDETLRYWLGFCLYHSGRPVEAENELSVALATNPLYHDALMLLAQIYQSTNRLPRAIATLEKAISNDGVENFLDFDALLQLLILHINSRNDRAIEKTARRLLSVVAIAGETAAVDGVGRMYQEAQKLLNTGKTLVAGELLRHTRRIAISDIALSAKVAEAARRVLLTDEAERLCRESTIPDYLKGYIQVAYLERVSDSKRVTLLQGMRSSLEAEVARDPAGFRLAVEQLRRSSVSVAADLYSLLQELGSGRTAAPPPSVPTPNTNRPAQRPTASGTGRSVPGAGASRANSTPTTPGTRTPPVVPPPPKRVRSKSGGTSVMPGARKKMLPGGTSTLWARFVGWLRSLRGGQKSG